MGNWTRLLKPFLDLFLKPNCPLCDRPAEEVLCKYCYRQLMRCQFARPEQFWSGQLPALIWGEYGGVMKRAIAAMKYNNHPELGQPLGRALAEAWLESVPYRRSGKLTVVPIPLHPKKLEERGFNQAELIAKSFCDLTGYPMEAGGIERTRQTQALFGLSREERSREISGALSVGKAFSRRSPRGAVLLIDDIYTTGSTCREAASVLRQQGISTYGVAAIATTKKKYFSPKRHQK